MKRGFCMVLSGIAFLNAVLSALDFPVWFLAGIYWIMVGTYWSGKGNEDDS